MRRAESIEFVGDEQGWEMHVTDEDGLVTRFNMHGLAWNLVDHMNDTIGDWRREGLAAAGLSSSAGDDLRSEDAEAYEPGSTKWLATLEPDLEFGDFRRDDL